MPFPLIPLAIAGGSALAGAFGNRGRKQTTTQDAFDPAFNPLRNQLIQQAMLRLREGATLPAGYETQGIGAINRSFELAGQGLENSLTARGLGSSPIAGNVLGNQAMARAGQIGQFRANLPLVQRQLGQDDLTMALQLLGLGRGGTTSTTTMQGDSLAGGFGSLAEALAFFAGSGALGGKAGRT